MFISKALIITIDGDNSRKITNDLWNRKSCYGQMSPDNQTNIKPKIFFKHEGKTSSTKQKINTLKRENITEGERDRDRLRLRLGLCLFELLTRSLRGGLGLCLFELLTRSLRGGCRMIMFTTTNELIEDLGSSITY